MIWLQVPIKPVVFALLGPIITLCDAVVAPRPVYAPMIVLQLPLVMLPPAKAPINTLHLPFVTATPALCPIMTFPKHVTFLPAL